MLSLTPKYLVIHVILYKNPAIKIGIIIIKTNIISIFKHIK